MTSAPEQRGAAATATATAPPGPAPRSLRELFLAFTGLALHGFGGVLPWAQRVIVEERRWLTREDFVEVLAFAQLLPGPNVCNLALMVGDRFFGWRGAIVALAGMLAAPAALVLTMATFYSHFADHPLFRQALTGMGAVAAGLVIATAFKMAMAYRKRWPWLAFGIAAFVGVGVLRMPLAYVVAVLGPIATVVAWWRRGTSR